VRKKTAHVYGDQILSGKECPDPETQTCIVNEILMASGASDRGLGTFETSTTGCKTYQGFIVPTLLAWEKLPTGSWCMANSVEFNRRFSKQVELESFDADVQYEGGDFMSTETGTLFGGKPEVTTKFFPGHPSWSFDRKGSEMQHKAIFFSEMQHNAIFFPKRAKPHTF